MPSTRGEALKWLDAQGFEQREARADRYLFEGQLACRAGPVRVSLRILDWGFQHYPKIRVLDRPAFLPALSPHLGQKGTLCYFAPGSVVLDRFDPREALAQCVGQATDLLDLIAADPHYRERDLLAEFPVYWMDGQDSIMAMLHGTVDRSRRHTNFYSLGQESPFLLLSDSQEEAEALAHVLHKDQPKHHTCPCWILKTEQYPIVGEEPLPTTVKAMFDWLRNWDPQLYGNVQHILGSDKTYLNYGIACFVLYSPIGILGFEFEIDCHKAKTLSRKPRNYRQCLHIPERGGKTPIRRLVFQDFGRDFIHSRNLLFPSLKDKQITLVGCGAIGGYVAEALVKLGAGTGPRGKLTLMDPDSLSADNLGRHCLGFPALAQYKACALAEELKRQFPLTHIDAVAKAAMPTAGLFQGDLVIDATGEEAFNESLNACHVELLGAKEVPPVLYVRIRGNGECVQGLWVDDLQHACLRCLLHPPGRKYREERHPTLKLPVVRGNIGCQAFTPYAVSSPMQAASLAADFVIDWLKGNPSPRFRTRYRENAEVSHHVKSQNVTRMAGCPACGHR